MSQELFHSRDFAVTAGTLHATLQSLPERWRGLDLLSASGKMLKVWGMREVAYNALDLQGRVFTVKVPFVVCEVRRAN